MAAQQKLQPVESFRPEEQALPRLGPILSEAMAHDPVASPALALQSALSEAFGEPVRLRQRRGRYTLELRRRAGWRWQP